MTAPPLQRAPMGPRLRGFWLLGAAVGLAVLAMGAALVRSELQLGHIEAFVALEDRSSTGSRAAEALDSWGRPWLETWLRDRGREPALADKLEACMKDFVYQLDELSVSTNVVRFEPIEEARLAATRCAAQQLGPDDAGLFVEQLQERWGEHLEQWAGD